MFKNYAGVATVALLTTKAAAIKLDYRPTAGSVPWEKPASRPSWEDPPYPHNYFVPNFGEDRDMKLTAMNLAKAEKEVNHTLKASFDKPKPPADYTIPDFGVDRDIITTQRNIADTEKELKHTLTSSFAKPKGPPDYSVPNFGVDHDVLLTQKNIKAAEKALNWKYSASFEKPKPPADYTVPNFGVDHDIKMTQKNIADAEAALGKWNVVQLDADVELESDPICSSAGCTQYKHKKTKLPYPIDYPVPNLGEDHDDVKTTANSLNIAEASHSHKWQWKDAPKDEPVEYEIRDLDVDMKNSLDNLQEAELRSRGSDLVQLDSDPICSSAGCTQFKHKKAKLGYPIDYPVPSFGADPDITANANSISIAEAMHKHKLIMGTPESKAKWHNVAKDTLYNFDPALDGDVVSTQSHLAGAEKTVGHKWVIEDVQLDEQSDPICSSAGCTQYKHKKAKLGYPIDYPVPNLGEDPEMTAAHNALSIAEAMHKHKLIMGTPESKAKWHNVAKDTEYNFAPDLDSDIVSTQSHLAGAE